MGIRKIVTNKALLQIPSDRCADNAERWPDVVADLFDTAKHYSENGRVGCAGLAANQIGEMLRCFVMNQGRHFIAVVDPEIISRGGGIKGAFEGCLSRPDARPIRVRRHKRIKVRYYDPMTADVITRKFSGFDARVFQHECDHLEGVLI